MDSSGLTATCQVYIHASNSDFFSDLDSGSGGIGTIYPLKFYFAAPDVIVYLVAACWLLCDYVDTIRDEMTYVWKRSLCLGSYLFFAMRYIGIISLLASFAIAIWPRPGYFEFHCDGYDYDAFPESEILNRDSIVVQFLSDTRGTTYWLAPALQFLVFWLVEVIMQMRIFALYDSRLLAVFNGALFIVEIAVMLYLWIQSPYLIGRLRGIPEDEPLTPTALSLVNSFQDSWPIYWIPAIVFELWLAGLALARLRRTTLKHDLINVLLKDSIMYFIMIAAFMVVHLVLGSHEHGSYAVPLMIAGETVAGSRLVLHLRTAYFRRRDIDTGVTHPSVSFAMPAQLPAVLSRVVDESFYTN